MSDDKDSAVFSGMPSDISGIHLITKSFTILLLFNY